MPLWLCWLFFQAAWLLLVLANQSFYYLLAIPLLVIYLFLEKKYSRPENHQYIACIILAISGCLFDSLLSYYNLIIFGESMLPIPLWLIILWLWFAFTLPACYSWAIKYPQIVIPLGGCLVPLTYWGASKITAAEIVSPLYFTLVSISFWTSLFALVFVSPLKRQFFTDQQSA